jgi:hypothetical protein
MTGLCIPRPMTVLASCLLPAPDDPLEDLGLQILLLLVTVSLALAIRLLAT